MSIATVQAPMIDRLPKDNSLFQFSNQPPLLLQNMPQQGKSVLFIDSSVASAEQLAAGAVDGTSTYLLDASRDEIAQITDVLSGLNNVGSVQIVSHGKSGGLQLGSSWLDLQTLPSYVDQLKSWGQALTAGADILLYGCNVGEGAVGQAFVNLLAETTGADVAASNDLTGSESLGGNWNLEVQTGRIETSIAIGTNALEQYADTLKATLVKNIAPGVLSSDISSLTNVNGTLYFVANPADSVNLKRLWKSNGTDSGTVPITTTTGNFLYDAEQLTNINGTLYFVARETSSNNLALWKTTSTGAVQNISPTPNTNLNISNLLNANGALYFFADSGSGRQLWKSSESSGSSTTSPITTFSGPTPFFDKLTHVSGTTGGKLYFMTNDSTSHSLWAVNLQAGASSSATLVSAFPLISELVNVNGTLFFTARPSNSGSTQLYKIDPSSSSPQLLTPPNVSASFFPRNLTASGNTLYFTASNSFGTGIWASNGTIDGTQWISSNIFVGSYSQISPYENMEIVDVNGTAYFKIGSTGSPVRGTRYGFSYIRPCSKLAQIAHSHEGQGLGAEKCV
ncbi:MAG: DUF4347 domain-containing protein [Alkalinema sp. RU_4_3]|nr:DUF4347 domain-containing protein [Alkalinema sp. RU_4_3]